MKIKFTHDFQGKLTNERFYIEGEEIEIDTDIGRQLIALNHAEQVGMVVKKPAEPVQLQEEPARTPRTRKSKAGAKNDTK